MSDQSTPVPDPAQPEQPPTPAAVPAPPGWRPAATPATAASAGPRRWWSEATSTGGGRAALAGVAVLAALFVVVGIGLTTALVVSHRGGDRGSVGMRGEMGPGDGRGMGQRDGNRDGRNKGGGDDSRRAPGRADPANPGTPFGPGQGMGSGQRPGQGQGLGRAADAALGAVLHGEFTTNLTGKPTVMVVQTGQVTAYTAGKSLTVKSTDGFEATYTLGTATPTLGSTTTRLADGVQVRVVAAKDGMAVTALVVG